MGRIQENDRLSGLVLIFVRHIQGFFLEKCAACVVESLFSGSGPIAFFNPESGRTMVFENIQVARKRSKDDNSRSFENQE